VLHKFKCELIGAAGAIDKAEDRLKFKDDDAHRP
jgi:hypothetical protein